MKAEMSASELPRTRPSPDVAKIVSALELLVIFILSAAAVTAWTVEVSRIDERLVDDTGLFAVMTPLAYAFMALLSAMFALTLRRRSLPQPLAAVQLLALVFMVCGAPVLFQDMPRFVTAWLHVGFTDAIAETGQLFPLRDGRFDWPGFFVLAAFIQNVVGADDLLPIIAWAPVLQVAAYLPPLYLIYRSATGDLRLIWLAMWLFVLTNWVGQDYFSPQGLNFLLMLTILAILLTWFRAPPKADTRLSRILARLPGTHRPGSEIVIDPDGPMDGGPAPRLSDVQQLGMMVVIAILFGFSASSHQLTPFAIIGATVLLALFGRLRQRGLPILMLLFVGAWLVFMATTFLDGRLSAILEAIGRPDQVAETNVAERLAGSAGHVFVVQLRLAFTAAVLGLGLLGGIRRLRAGRFDLSLALLAVAPFGLVLFQGYGGEIVLRIFFFALPFVAFFAAATIFPAMAPTSWRSVPVIVALSVILCVGLILTRYGNEKADIVTRGDFQAIEFVTSLAPDGSSIGTVNHRIPIEYRDWELHRFPNLTAEFLEGDIDLLREHLLRNTEPGEPAYVVVARSNRSHAELYWGWSDAQWDERIAQLDAEFEVAFRNDDATVYRVVAASSATP